MRCYSCLCLCFKVFMILISSVSLSAKKKLRVLSLSLRVIFDFWLRVFSLNQNYFVLLSGEVIITFICLCFIGLFIGNNSWTHDHYWLLSSMPIFMPINKHYLNSLFCKFPTCAICIVVSWLRFVSRKVKIFLKCFSRRLSFFHSTLKL